MAKVAQARNPNVEEASRRSWTFVIKAAATTLAGSLLSLSVAVAQTWYSKRVEMLDRQSQHGAQFQAAILEATGNIENHVMSILEEMRNGEEGAIEQARVILEDKLEPAVGAWRTGVLVMRNRGADIYGRDVARLVYDSSEKFYHVDQCNVVVRFGQTGGGENCDNRRRSELRRLLAVREEISGIEPDLSRATAQAPYNLHTNINIIHYLIVRYLNCAGRRDAGRLTDTRCGDQELILRIIQTRAELFNILRENLANQMMHAAVIQS